MTPLDQSVQALALEFHQDGMSATPEAVASLHAQACAGGAAVSCRASEWRTLEGKWARADLADAGPIAAELCGQGDAVACLLSSWAVFAAGGERQVGLDHLAKACAAGLERACGEAAYLEQTPGVAITTIDRACVSGVGNACMLAGNLYRTGATDLSVDLVLAAERFKAGCTLGDVESCTNLARAEQLGEGVPADFPSAEGRFQAACFSGGDGRACALLAAIYAPDGPVPMSNAHDEEVARACELGYLASCPPAPAAVASAPVEVPPAPIEPPPPPPDPSLVDRVSTWLGDWFPWWVAPFLPLILLAQHAYRKRKADAWVAAAHGAGLVPTGAWPDVAMSGKLAGVEVKVRQWEASHGRKDDHSGKGRTTSRHVRAEASTSRDLAGLVVYEEGWMSTVGKAFGMTDVEIGDPAFDKVFVVKCADPEVARRALDAPVRRALLDTFAMLGSVGIEDGKIVYAAHSEISGKRAIDIALALATCSASFGDA